MAMLFSAAPALAETPSAYDYPSSGKDAEVLAWTLAHTSIKREAILAITPGVVTALDRLQRPSAGSTVAQAVLREEFTDPRLAAAAGGRSGATEAEVNCADRSFRLGLQTTFARPDRTGPPQTRPGAAAWAPVQDHTIMAQLLQAACNPQFAMPYAAPKSAAPVSPAPPNTASGAWRVVLGSFSEEAHAKAAATALRRNFATALEGRDAEVRPVAVGGRRYYLLEARGFDGRPAAETFCAQVSAAGGECLLRRPPAR